MADVAGDGARRPALECGRAHLAPAGAGVRAMSALRPGAAAVPRAVGGGKANGVRLLPSVGAACAAAVPARVLGAELRGRRVWVELVLAASYENRAELEQISWSRIQRIASGSSGR